MSDRAVELDVAGTRCRVVTTASEAELQQLTDMVSEKLAAVLPPGRPATTQAMLLAAVALANEVKDQRERADAIANKAKAVLGQLLARVDGVIEVSDELSKERESRRKRGDEPAARKSNAGKRHPAKDSPSKDNTAKSNGGEDKKVTVSSGKNRGMAKQLSDASADPNRSR